MQSTSTAESSVPREPPSAGDIAPPDEAASGRDPLVPYFREIAGFEVMSREAEQEAAGRIAQLRRSFWLAALAYPPFIDGICTLVPQVLPACPEAPLAELRRAARALRDRELIAHQRAFEAAREQLAATLVEADLDGLLADRLVADLIGLEAGASEGLSMRLKLPPRGSLVFLGYLNGVRAEHQALAAAKAAFVTANLRLVVAIARRFGTLRMSLQDLIQDGNLGLLKAVERFDPRKGFRFSTYASWWIRHAIGRAIADKGRAVRLPVHMIEAHNKVRRARAEFELREGRTPSDAELAIRTGISIERLQRMHTSLVEQPISLDQPLTSGADVNLVDALPDPDALVGLEALDHGRLVAQLHDALDGLPAIEADILRRRMGLGDAQAMTLKQIGERYSLSRERIRQLQELALQRLRGEFKRRALL
jgi:RNA polymerase primary sigma factor